MATSLVFKVRDSVGVLVASTKLIGDAVIVSARHGKGTKISHMHFGVLATVDDGVMSACAIDSLRERAIAKLNEKREKLRQEHERTLEAERQRRLERAQAESAMPSLTGGDA